MWYSLSSRIARTLLTFAFLIFPAVTYGNVSYTVAPLIIDTDVEARDIENYTITLTNTGDTPATIYPTVNNISVTEGGTIEQFLPPVMSDQTSSLASWIEISRAGIDLFPGTTKTITLVLRVNPNADPGEYHAFVGFPYGGNRDEAEKMVARGDAQGVVVSASLVDTKVSLLKLSRFLVDRFITSVDNEAATYTVKNPGEEPLVPSGEIIFYNSRGSEVGSVPVNPDKVIIPPGKEQLFTANVPADGLFGKYKAFLTVEFGRENMASVQDTAFFYALPLRTLLIALGGVLIMVSLMAFFIHRKYFDEVNDDGSELLPLHVRETKSDPLHHDIDLRKL